MNLSTVWNFSVFVQPENTSRTTRRNGQQLRSRAASASATRKARKLKQILRFAAIILAVRDINLFNIVERWFFDGVPAGWTELITAFAAPAGHLCLEHAKKNASKRPATDHTWIIKNYMDFTAFY